MCRACSCRAGKIGLFHHAKTVTMNKDLFEDIKLSEEEEKLYHKAFDKVTKTVIKQAKQSCPAFAELFNSCDYDLSYQHGFKTRSSHSLFHLHIVAKHPLVKWKLLQKEDDTYGSVHIHFPDPTPSSQTWRSLLVEDKEQRSFLSADKLAKVFLQSVDTALDKLGNKIVVGRQEFKVTLSMGSLEVEGDGLQLTVRLVTCLDLQVKHLKVCQQLKDRVEKLMLDSGVDCKTFRVLGHPDQGEAFLIGFPNLERSLLKEHGSAQEVGCVLWHLFTEEAGGVQEVQEVWVRLLQVLLLQQVVGHLGQQQYWVNIEECVLDCLRALQEHLHKGRLNEIFFPEVIFELLAREYCIFNQASSGECPERSWATFVEGSFCYCE